MTAVKDSTGFFLDAFPYRIVYCRFRMAIPANSGHWAGTVSCVLEDCWTRDRVFLAIFQIILSCLLLKLVWANKLDLGRNRWPWRCSTLHTAHCTLHTANCTMKTPYCTLDAAHWTLNTAQYTLHAKLYTMHSAHFLLHTEHCTLNTAHCTLNTAHCTLNTAHCILHTRPLHYQYRYHHFLEL